MLLRKLRAYAEVYNDLDDDVVTLFRVLRDPGAAARLREVLHLTPVARAEFRDSYSPSDDLVERSRRLIVRSFMGFGSNAAATPERGHRSTGFRASSSRSGTTPARDWQNYPEALDGIAERLRGVVVENRPAVDVIVHHDRPETLHYVDPPYLPELRARSKWHGYRHELTREDHVELLAVLRGVAGMVVLSGYPDPLYDGALPGWRRFETAALADGARPRTEVLWLNPAAVEALEAGRAQPRLELVS